MNADEILTGEGVTLHVGAASVIMRAGAWLVDAIVSSTFCFTILIPAAAALNLDDAATIAVLMIVLAILFLGIPITVETLTHGRSLGKLMFGLQVIRDDGGPVRLQHAAVRALLGTLELWGMAGGLAFIVSMFNDRGKRLGDFLAGTYVANVRAARSTILPLMMPPELAGWARMTDIRPLPDALALRVRQFLARATQFPPPIRHRLGLRLAAQVELFVSPSPPPFTHPERFLAAVLTERRIREQRAQERLRPRLSSQLAGIEILPYGIPDPD